MDPFITLVRALNDRQVRFVVIGVWGANYWARTGATVFTTDDRDLFLPLQADNLVMAWQACEAAEFTLWSGLEPLDMPRDRWLAEKVIERRAAVKAIAPDGLNIDVSLVMKGFGFEEVWNGHRVFTEEGVDVPVARLLHIVQSKHATGRDKDRLFLATHREALMELLGREENER